MSLPELPPQHVIKDWVLEPRNKKDDSNLKIHYVTQAAAEAIARVWKNTELAELRDDRGNLNDLVSRKDYRLRKLVEENLENKKGAWICDHDKPQPMSKGCYIDDFGNKSWKADCGCPETKQVEPWYNKS